MSATLLYSFWHNAKLISIYKAPVGYHWQVAESTLYDARVKVHGTVRHHGWHPTSAGARRTALRATKWTASWERRTHRPSPRSHGRSLR